MLLTESVAVIFLDSPLLQPMVNAETVNAIMMFLNLIFMMIYLFDIRCFIVLGFVDCFLISLQAFIYLDSTLAIPTMTLDYNLFAII
jgi:hypothetical protein